MVSTPDREREGLARIGAWGVHLFTASGVVLGLLALDAVSRGEWREALLWLFVALVVDGVDGTLARMLRVPERVPRIDGAAMDLVIDYLNYVVVPALILWRGGFLPDEWALVLCSAILLSSLYVFVRRDMKTNDGYFQGFPALWNVVAVYFVVTPPSEWVAAAIVVLLVVLTFAPIHVVHPFRATDAKRSAPVLALVWSVSTAVLAVAELPAAWTRVLLVVSYVSLAGLVALGLRRTLRGPRGPAIPIVP